MTEDEDEDEDEGGMPSRADCLIEEAKQLIGPPKQGNGSRKRKSAGGVDGGSHRRSDRQNLGVGASKYGYQ